MDYHDKILPDDKWNSAQKSKTTATNKTQSHNNIYIAHQTKPILKVTPPVNFQFLEKHQQKAYLTAMRLAETLGYNNKTLQPLKLISTQEHIKYLQQLTPSKVSHNRTINFNVEDKNDPINKSNNEMLTETHIIFSVLNCTSFQESHLRSRNSYSML